MKLLTTPSGVYYTINLKGKKSRIYVIPDEKWLQLKTILEDLGFEITQM